MGLIRTVFRALFAQGGLERLARAGTDVADSFRPNATRRMELGQEAFTATQSAYAAEFRNPRRGLFDSFVNGLNRMPRPMLALGTLGLFVYAMADPAGFVVRMRGLAEVPEPLWWLLGAVVAFYFGARETYYRRERTGVARAPAMPQDSAVPTPGASAGTPSNPALQAWREAMDDPNRERG